MTNVIQANFRNAQIPMYNPEGIEKTDTGFYTKHLPMGATGIKLDRPVSSGIDLLKAAGLNYTVEKRALKAVDNDSQLINVKSHVSLIRSDLKTSIGVVDPNYGIIQPQQAFSIFDDFGHDLAWEVAGSLRGGSRMYAMAKLKSFEVVPGDQVDHYLLLYLSFDGSSAMKAIFTTNRLACMNMLRSLLSEDGISIRHTRWASSRLNFAKKVLQATAGESQKVEEMYKFFAGKRFHGRQMEELAKQLIPDPPKNKDGTERSKVRAENNRYELTRCFYEGAGQNIPGVAGTAWAASNAITEYVTHHRTSRGGDEKRFESALVGSGNDLSRTGNLLLLDMVA